MYLQNGNSLEFPDQDGNFLSLENEYGDGTYFKVISSNPSPEPVQATSSQPNRNEPQTSFQQRRKSLCAIKIVRADVGSNGKPSNVLSHNHTVHLNIYSEDEANVATITNKIHEEMNDDSLVLVNSNCLEFLDQEGTRG